MTTSERRGNPFDPFVASGRICVLDGGLATTLEADGYDLHDDLWSARMLMEAPGAIRGVHRAFLEAGADCITTASYQASLPGFLARGVTRAEAEELIRRSVTLACEERDGFWRGTVGRAARRRPLVAASVGPYGAFLADGSEYVGRYGIAAEELRAFHEPRWRILADTEADLLACETIPDALEVEVLLAMLADTPGRWAWISVSCRDERHLCDGTEVRDVARLCDGSPGVAAIGINCTAPHLISGLVDELRAGTHLPVIVYPNSGERYDAATRGWEPGAPFDWRAAVREWMALGVVGIGGCCRMGPDAIAAIRAEVPSL